MGCCRFQNASIYFENCISALDEMDIDSEDELKYAKKMYDMAKKYIDIYEFNINSIIDKIYKEE